jgi:CDP-glucose 4,6-dehydratase
MAFWQNKKVLITGHTGFKGSWLTVWLEMLGARLTGLALPPPTQPSLFALAGLERRIQSILGDIRDLDTVRQAVRAAQPDVVFHMAAQPLVRRSFRDPVETYATNVMGTVHVLEAIRELRQPCVVVNVTSDKCYENREWEWPYRESEPMGGYDPYSSSKGCAELVTAAYRRSYFQGAGSAGGRKALASVRAGNVIGGGDWAEERLIPDCIRHFAAGTPVPIRNPASIRPWQHVLEPLHGYLLLAERLAAQPDDYAQAWNFGPPDVDAKPVRWIVDHLVRRWGHGVSWAQAGAEPLHEAATLKLDSSLARTRLGWRTRLRLPEALDWVTDWYRRQHAGEPAARLTEQQIEAYQQREPSEP